MADSRLTIAEQPCDCQDGAETPFGLRWGGEVIKLSLAHLEALQQGKTLYVDVQGEYLVNLQLEESTS